VVCVREVDVFRVAIRCAFSSGEVENGGAGVCEEVEWALVIECSMARRMHSWSYFGFAMFVQCHV
jgi:hypothetical protein